MDINGPNEADRGPDYRLRLNDYMLELADQARVEDPVLTYDILLNGSVAPIPVLKDWSQAHNCLLDNDQTGALFNFDRCVSFQFKSGKKHEASKDAKWRSVLLEQRSVVVRWLENGRTDSAGYRTLYLHADFRRYRPRLKALLQLYNNKHIPFKDKYLVCVDLADRLGSMVSQALLYLSYANMPDLDSRERALLKMRAAYLYTDLELNDEASEVLREVIHGNNEPVFQAEANLRLGIVAKEAGYDERAMVYVQEVMKLEAASALADNASELRYYRVMNAAHAFYVVEAQASGEHLSALYHLREIHPGYRCQFWLDTSYDWSVRRLKYEHTRSTFMLIFKPLLYVFMIAFIAALAFVRSFRQRMLRFIGRLESDDVVCIIVMLSTLNMLLVVFTFTFVIPAGYFNYPYLIISFVLSCFMFFVALMSPMVMSSSQENNRILSICALLLFISGFITIFSSFVVS